MVGARVAPATLHPPKLPGVAATFGLPGTTLTGTASPSASAIAWKQLPPAKGAFVPIKLVIEKLGVQAGVETKGIDSHNVMESPDHPNSVAWYRFTAQPGSGGNAVFSGHLDYWGVGPAVFWRLRDLQAGDSIDVVSGESTEVRYKLTQTWSYVTSTMPMQTVLAPSKEDQITLITCAGSFHNGGYDHRLVVRAVKA